MSDYATDRMWSDRFIPEIKRIVGPLLLQESPLDVDRKENADLIIMKAKDMTIAARIRRPGFFARYPMQFTIRSSRANGTRTELSKIIDGLGDWMFYGHSDDDELCVAHWMLLDLAAFRSHLIRRRNSLKMGERKNTDGRTSFCWFDVESFDGPPPLLLASSFELNAA